MATTVSPSALVDTVWNLFITFVYPSGVGVLHTIYLSHRARRAGRPHSRSIRVNVKLASGHSASIHTLALLEDNYGFMIVDSTNSEVDVVLVDMGDGREAIRQIQEVLDTYYRNRRTNFHAILTTHHHWDHMHGNDSVMEHFGISRCYSSRGENVLCQTHEVGDQAMLTFGHMIFEVISTPSHTQGSVVFKLTGANGIDCLFTGDTLFNGGIGVPFEGSAAQAKRSLVSLLRRADLESLVFPGHEYTLPLLSEIFSHHAKSMLDDHPRRFYVLCGLFTKAQHYRSLPFPTPTVPMRLGDEACVNPVYHELIEAASALRTLAKVRMIRQLAADDLWHPKLSDIGTPSEANSGIRIVTNKETNEPVVVEPPWVVSAFGCDLPIAGVWSHDLMHLRNCLQSVSEAVCSERRSQLLDHCVEFLDTYVLSHPLPDTVWSFPRDCQNSQKLFGGVHTEFAQFQVPNTRTIQKWLDGMAVYGWQLPAAVQKSLGASLRSLQKYVTRSDFVFFLANVGRDSWNSLDADELWGRIGRNSRPIVLPLHQVVKALQIPSNLQGEPGSRSPAVPLFIEAPHMFSHCKICMGRLVPRRSICPTGPSPYDDVSEAMFVKLMDEPRAKMEEETEQVSASPGGRHQWDLVVNSGAALHSFSSEEESVAIRAVEAQLVRS